MSAVGVEQDGVGIGKKRICGFADLRMLQRVKDGCGCGGHPSFTHRTQPRPSLNCDVLRGYDECCTATLNVCNKRKWHMLCCVIHSCIRYSLRARLRNPTS